MSNLNTVGTPLGCSYGGLDFRIKADASITEMFRKYTNEIIVTTGKGMNKRLKAVQSLAGVPFVTNQRERSDLDNLGDSGFHKFAYTDAAGVTISGQAILAGDSSRTSDEGTYTSDMHFDEKPSIIYP